MTRPHLLPLLLAAAATFTFTACSGGHDTAAPARPGAHLPAVDVATTTVSAATTPQIRHLPGTVQATSRATVAAKVMGTVTTAPSVGQSVAAGEVVLTVAADELKAAVASARAALDLATRNHQRESDLLARGASTAETVRNLDDQRRIAAAQLEAATAQLSYTQVTAPFAGTITTRYVETGDLAAPGAPLFTLEGAHLEVQVAVPESLAAATLGDTLTVELSDDSAVSATVTEASPAADPVTRSRLVRLALPANASATAGQFVRVRWPDAAATVIRVPSSAVSAFGQMQRVFVATDGHAILRLVKTGHVQDGATVILSGLNPGETIVTDPPATLRDGQPLNLNAAR
ncbi:efflux RND transporter periplasmic adaptor subunit [Actomonas aquatica]|uniref:Efflux RND transporter periplasmic adaptor subunit n=1 Tax=Actomonas aquatica TaxID=2866162 RepID=A0ABZ1C472_9BACT|nr:efflux RND transporter periplasmic adaptor subunit [Opitutus sp. WL0086]WRQ86344.1 efflux RND transporter periplasmic adaptor subunit [Opitutus sp. WL0086]